MLMPLGETDPESSNLIEFKELSPAFIANSTAFMIGRSEQVIDVASAVSGALVKDFLGSLAAVPSLTDELGVDAYADGLLRTAVNNFTDPSFAPTELFGATIDGNDYLLPIVRFLADQDDPLSEKFRITYEYDIKNRRINSVMFYTPDSKVLNVQFYCARHDKSQSSELKRLLRIGSNTETKTTTIDASEDSFILDTVEREGAYYKKSTAVYENVMSAKLGDGMYCIYASNIQDDQHQQHRLLGLN